MSSMSSLALDALLRLQLGDDEIEELLDFMDVDGSGTIDYHEFVMGVLEDKQLLTEAKLRAAFDYFDLDHNGTIDIGERLLAMLLSQSFLRIQQPD